MQPISVVAVGAISPLGNGRAAFHPGVLDEPARSAITRDTRLSALGLQRPLSARCHLPEDNVAHVDRARLLLEAAAGSLVADLDRVRAAWRTARIGVLIGTSGGGMPSLERALAVRARGERIAPELARAAPYFGPLEIIDSVLNVESEHRVQILAACISSTVAIGLGCRWLDAGWVDLVIAGGYDAITPFIAAGFEALGATSAFVPQPFRSERSGMCLGEGALLLALERASRDTQGRPRRPLVDAAHPLTPYIVGFGFSADAVHVTAPDPSGAGLARAAMRAIKDAGISAAEIELVSAHATATAFNDAAEARAMQHVLGAHAPQVVVHPFKAVIGHALGASGALELCAAMEAQASGIRPAAVGSGGIDSGFSSKLLERAEAGATSHLLKLSAAFGGANAALVVSSSPERVAPTGLRRVSVLATGEGCSDLGEVVRLRTPLIRSSKWLRADALSQLVVIATARAAMNLVNPLPEVSGIVLGTATATLEINEIFHRRLRERGARWVEPRRFPATSPNLACGECGIAFGLRGPALTVGWDHAAPLEALLVAFDLIACGDADLMIVVAADYVDEVIVDLWSAAGWAMPAHGACAVVLGVDERTSGLPRAALLELLTRARKAGGKLGREQPGWPALRAAITELAGE